jgi:hypothetical protein
MLHQMHNPKQRELASLITSTRIFISRNDSNLQAPNTSDILDSPLSPLGASKISSHQIIFLGLIEFENKTGNFISKDQFILAVILAYFN